MARCAKGGYLWETSAERLGQWIHSRILQEAADRQDKYVVGAPGICVVRTLPRDNDIGGHASPFVRLLWARLARYGSDRPQERIIKIFNPFGRRTTRGPNYGAPTTADNPRPRASDHSRTALSVSECAVYLAYSAELMRVKAAYPDLSAP